MLSNMWYIRKLCFFCLWAEMPLAVPKTNLSLASEIPVWLKDELQMRFPECHKLFFEAVLHDSKSGRTDIIFK